MIRLVEASIIAPIVSSQLTYRFQVGSVTGKLDDDQTPNAAALPAEQSSNKSIELNESDEQPSLGTTTYLEDYN